MKTYAETAQGHLFVAAARMYDIACCVLDDCTEPAEFTGATYEWARDLAKEYAERAQALKEEAVEMTPVRRAPRAYNAAQLRYRLAVERHLRLRKKYLDLAA